MLNFEVKCIFNRESNRYIKSNGFTQGKIYKVENGFLYCDNERIWDSQKQFNSIDSINKDMHKFGVASRFELITE